MVLFFFLMIRLPPRSTRTDTLFPYTTLFRSIDRATDDGIPCHLAPVDRGFTHRFSPSAHVDAARNPPRPSFRPHRASQAGPCSSTPSRSEEHTSELQSLMRISYAVFCLKKKK